MNAHNPSSGNGLGLPKAKKPLEDVINDAVHLEALCYALEVLVDSYETDKAALMSISVLAPMITERARALANSLDGGFEVAA